MNEITKPVVGKGATLFVGSDRYPYTVVEVVNENKCFVQADNCKVVKGSEHDGSAEYEYTSDPYAFKFVIKRNKKNPYRWYSIGGASVGNLVCVGSRRRYYDPSF